MIAIRAALFDAKLSLLGQLEYRGSFVIWALGDTIRSLVSLAVWLAVRESSPLLPMDRGQLVTYFVAQAVVYNLTLSWLIYYIPDNIREGHLSGHLLRPVPPMAYWIGSIFGQKALRCLLLVPIVAAAALLFNADLRLPHDPGTWLAVFISVVLAAVVSFLLDMVVCSLAFWLQDVWGISSAVSLAERLFNGAFIPLALLPPWLLGIAYAQPFRYTLSFPLEILTGAIAPDAIAPGFAWQAGYAVGLYLLYRLQWRYGLRAYSAVGA
jgi:ABC-2 type transport system permease protein